MTIRYNSKMPIIAENFKIRLKKNGGIKFLDEDGNEISILKMLEKARPAEDEFRREMGMFCVYTDIEFEFITKELPITIEAISGTTTGGTAAVNRIYTNDSLENWKELIDYIKSSILFEMIVNGSFVAYKNILSSNNLGMQLAITKTETKETPTLKLINSRTSDVFKYNEVFVKKSDADGFDFTSSTITIIEKRIENILEETLQDLDLSVRIQFYGELDVAILNS